MTLEWATHYAEKIQEWIAPACERIQVAGSVRRRRPHCKDIDLVLIPKIEVEKDMLGEETARFNKVALFLADYIHNTEGAGIMSGTGPDPDITRVQLPKCVLDIFFASQENWASRLLCRTGSAAHNVYLIEKAKSLGLVWKPQQGIIRDGQVIPAETEEDIFTMLQMDYLTPEQRER